MELAPSTEMVIFKFNVVRPVQNCAGTETSAIGLPWAMSLVSGGTIECPPGGGADRVAFQNMARPPTRTTAETATIVLFIFESPLRPVLQRVSDQFDLSTDRRPVKDLYDMFVVEADTAV